MLEAKDTVMTIAAINEVRLQKSKEGKAENVTGWCKIIAQGQAEISFKAGIKEVVEFVNDEVFPMLNMASIPVSFKDRWNNKLKEWGIE